MDLRPNRNLRRDETQPYVIPFRPKTPSTPERLGYADYTPKIIIANDSEILKITIFCFLCHEIIAKDLKPLFENNKTEQFKYICNGCVQDLEKMKGTFYTTFGCLRAGANNIAKETFKIELDNYSSRCADTTDPTIQQTNLGDDFYREGNRRSIESSHERMMRDRKSVV